MRMGNSKVRDFRMMVLSLPCVTETLHRALIVFLVLCCGALPPGLFGMPARAEPRYYPDPVTWKQRKSGPDDVTILMTNASPLPVTVRIEVTGENINLRGTVLTCIAPLSTVEALRLRPSDPEKPWSGHWEHHVVFGDFRATAASEPCRLPWTSGFAFRITQGYHGATSHTGLWEYSVDFDLPLNTPVRAARDGVVVACEEGYTAGGQAPRFSGKDNYVTIGHLDGTLSRYAHLRANGVSVEVGDSVRAGQLLGYSGSTGLSSGPHLHFDVVVPNKDLGLQTVPFVLDTTDGLITPSEGMTLRAL